jgi:Immunity protein 8
MKAEIKRLHSPDIYNLENFSPINNEVYFLLQIMIGVKGKSGEESFDIIVSTPQYLLQNQEEIMFGSNHLIILEYNYQKILEKLQDYIENLEGENWDELADKISRIAKWEFEDYH